jgi:hypothetical protein
VMIQKKNKGAIRQENGGVLPGVQHEPYRLQSSNYERIHGVHKGF